MPRLTPVRTLALGGMLAALAGCDAGVGGTPAQPANAAEAASLGDPRRGAELIGSAGCGACHAIPGIPNAVGHVGPPLGDVGARAIIAGVLANTPQNMVAWLKEPQRIVPGNAMPNMELNDDEARDIAAYLLTLR